MNEIRLNCAKLVRMYRDCVYDMDYVTLNFLSYSISLKFNSVVIPNQ